MTELFVIIISTALVNNLFLDYALGAETSEGFSRRLDIAHGLSMVIIVLMPLTCAFSYLASQLLNTASVGYLSLPAYVIIIFTLMTLLKLMTTRFVPQYFPLCDLFFPIAGINTAILGAILLSVEFSHSMFSALVFGLGSAVGFAISLILLTGMRVRMEMLDMPEAFKGLPVTLIATGIMSMAFMGFAGLVQTG